MGNVWQLADVQASEGGDYAEFLRRPSMSAGVYRLGAGAADPQRPHREDEVYVVLSGQGKLRHGDTVDEVGPGSIAFVPAGEMHRFEDITEDLEILVVFAPAETDPAGD